MSPDQPEDRAVWLDTLPPWLPSEGRFGFFSTREDDERASTVLAHVEDALGCRFHDRRLLRCALTSAGWCNEHKGQLAPWPSNKSFEWMGDAVLNLLATEPFVRDGRAADTGSTTPSRARLVSDEALARAGHALELWDVLYLGRGERRNNETTGRTTYVARAVEAVVGALWFDARRAGLDPLVTVTPSVRRILQLAEPGSASR